MMLVASVSLLACSGPFPYLWFFSWRFASGVAGGVLMVLAATTVLPLIAPKKRGFASGLMFTGVGLGIVASGTLVPLVMRLGLVETWLAIGATAALATVGAWHGWPAPVVDPIPHQTSLAISQKLRSHRSLNALLLVYFLTGVALVPHMVFLVDFVARHLKEGLQTGSGFWVLFGLGALVGPVCAGWMGDRVGFRAALRTVLAIEAFAIGLSAANAHSVLLGLSSVLVGAFVPGVVPLVLGRIQELVHYDEGRRSAWGAATIAFAAGQAGGGIVFSALFAQSGGSYSLLFGLGAATLASALLVVLGTS
jgi:predicted MFS family arabinose efflux permease